MPDRKPPAWRNQVSGVLSKRLGEADRHLGADAGLSMNDVGDVVQASLREVGTHILPAFRRNGEQKQPGPATQFEHRSPGSPRDAAPERHVPSAERPCVFPVVERRVRIPATSTFALRV